MIPTVGFNMRKVTKGNVTIKVMVIFINVDSITAFRYIFLQKDFLLKEAVFWGDFPKQEELSL